MKAAPGSAAPEPPGDGPGGAASDDAPKLPGLRTWPAVYLAVAASFVLWLVLLAVLTRRFA